MAEEQCLEGVIRALSSVCPNFLGFPRFGRLAVTLLTVLKNLSMEPSTLEALDKAGAITTLVSLLGRGQQQQQQQQQQPREGRSGGTGTSSAGFCSGGDEDLENQVLQCMFYLCRISRKRQEKAARAGLIPHLRRWVLEQSRLKQFALQMVCDFAHTSSVVRSLMWDEGVLDFYLSVMRSPKDTHWHVTIFRSICAWLSSESETERVAGRLVEPQNLDKVIFLFCTAQQVDFEQVVDKLHVMMIKSQGLVKALGSSATFIVEIMERLHYPKAVVGKTLLGMLRMIHQQHPSPAALVRDFDLYRIVLTLSRNESQVLVAELAGQLLQDFDRRGQGDEGGGGGGSGNGGGGGGGGGGGSGGGGGGRSGSSGSSGSGCEGVDGCSGGQNGDKSSDDDGQSKTGTGGGVAVAAATPMSIPMEVVVQESSDSSRGGRGDDGDARAGNGAEAGADSPSRPPPAAGAATATTRVVSPSTAPPPPPSAEAGAEAGAEATVSSDVSRNGPRYDAQRGAE